jgi:hypothetical protein
MPSSIPTSAVLVADPSHPSAEVEGEVVVLQLRTGTYFGVDGVAAFLWRLLQEPTTVESLRSAVINEYAVSPETAEQDIDRFLRDLIDAGLVVISE